MYPRAGGGITAGTLWPGGVERPLPVPNAEASGPAFPTRPAGRPALHKFDRDMTRTSKYCPTTHPAAEAAPTRPDRVGVSRPRTVRQPLIALLPLAFLLVMTASCQREPLPQDPGTYIAFTPDLTPTKAPVEGPIESAGQISEFAVWANYDDGSGTINEIMDNIRVYIRDGLWVYDYLKPWETGSWKFYAFYPYDYDPSVLKVDVYIPKTEGQTDEGIEIEYFDGSAMNIDLMSAEVDRNVDLTDNTNTSTSPVAFTFQHLLSRIDIVAKSANGEVEVTALTFSGMDVYGTYNHQDETATGYQDKWTLISEYNGQSLNPGSVSLTFPDGSTSISVPASDTPTSLLTDLLLIPQTPGTDCKITVTYTSTYHTEPQTREITLPSDPTWERAHRYVYTIIFNERDITLNINIVEWEETYKEEVIW